MVRQQRSQRGVVLITVLMLAVMLAAIGAGVTWLASYLASQTTRQELASRSLGIAEAELHRVYNNLPALTLGGSPVTAPPSPYADSWACYAKDLTGNRYDVLVMGQSSRGVFGPEVTYLKARVYKNGTDFKVLSWKQITAEEHEEDKITYGLAW